MEGGAEKWDIRRSSPTVTGFEVGGRAKECRMPLEAGKGKGTDFPLEPTERTALQTP